MPRISEEELMNFALSQVPQTGEIAYSQLHQTIRQSENPEAVSMLPILKRRGLVTARIEFTPDGVKHFYARKVS